MKPAKYSEKDIQSTIRFLKIKNPDKATRADAIKFLNSMKTTAHMIAHTMVDAEKDKLIN